MYQSQQICSFSSELTLQQTPGPVGVEAQRTPPPVNGLSLSPRPRDWTEKAAECGQAAGVVFFYLSPIQPGNYQQVSPPNVRSVYWLSRLTNENK